MLNLRQKNLIEAYLKEQNPRSEARTQHYVQYMDLMRLQKMLNLRGKQIKENIY